MDPRWVLCHLSESKLVTFILVFVLKPSSVFAVEPLSCVAIIQKREKERILFENLRDPPLRFTIQLCNPVCAFSQVKWFHKGLGTFFLKWEPV